METMTAGSLYHSNIYTLRSMIHTYGTCYVEVGYEHHVHNEAPLVLENFIFDNTKLHNIITSIFHH